MSAINQMEAVRPASARAAVESDGYRPPYLAAAIAAAAVFVLYAITLAPTTAFWDTSEYIATARILGIPHPPGNPLFVVLARAWDLLLAPLGLSHAVRINLFSAVMSALAHGFWFLLVDRILAFYSTDRRFRLVGAAVAVLISATAFTVWNQSNVNEKVYTVSLFTIALLSWLAFRWRDNLGETKDDNLILLMLFILALSVGNHLMAFLAAPALVLFILLVDWRAVLPFPVVLLVYGLLMGNYLMAGIGAAGIVGFMLVGEWDRLRNWRVYVAGVFVILLGLSVHLYLPIRAGLRPVINEADPTCESVSSAIVSVATMGRAGCDDLSAALKREQYDKPSMFLNPIAYAQGYQVPRDAELIAAQYATYAQYFDWQWARAVNGLQSFFGPIRTLITLLFTGLGLFGALTHYRRDRTSWVYFALLFATLSIGLTFYLNFKYGFTHPGVSRDQTEVRERDYFFIVSFSLWGLWVGVGLAALWLWLSERAARGVEAARRAVFERLPAARLQPSWRLAPVLAIGLIPLFANWSWADRSYDWSARDWAYNLLMSVEPYAVLFTNGDNDTFPLWYLQETEGIRRDVTVIVMSYLNTPWYARQLRDLTQPCPPGVSPDQDPTRIICQRPYEPEQGPDFYRQYVMGGDTSGVSADTPTRGAPTRSILPLSDEEIQQVTDTPPFLLGDGQVFRAHGIEAPLPANTVMVPADMFLATIIDAALGDRPIYFAMTTQAYEELNLRPFLIRQGVALKLNDGPVEADTVRGIHPIPPSPFSSVLGNWIDVPRTEALLSNVFIHRGGLPSEWNHWVDVATEGIPAYYGYTHRGMALVYESLGRIADAERHLALSDQWFELANKRFLAGNQ